MLAQLKPHSTGSATAKLVMQQVAVGLTTTEMVPTQREERSPAERCTTAADCEKTNQESDAKSPEWT